MGLFFLILNNSTYKFQYTSAIKNGLMIFYKMIVTAIKSASQKLKPKFKHYRDYNQFSNNEFRKNLLNKC